MKALWDFLTGFGFCIFTFIHGAIGVTNKEYHRSSSSSKAY
ncbi:hypothetical protein OROGR_014750 [Orobanche gracilis]